jgi:hypothetical protein
VRNESARRKTCSVVLRPNTRHTDGGSAYDGCDAHLERASRLRGRYRVPMDWSSFPSDFLAGLIGTMVGLFAGLQLDRWQARRQSRERDERMLQNLIDRLANERAFRGSAPVGPEDDPADRERCIKSVVDTRRRVADLCDNIATHTRCVPVLRTMEADCNAYLHHVERHRELYAVGLNSLRERLHDGERALQALVPPLIVTAPGARTAVSPDWLTAAH